LTTEKIKYLKSQILLGNKLTGVKGLEVRPGGRVVE